MILMEMAGEYIDRLLAVKRGKLPLIIIKNIITVLCLHAEAAVEDIRNLNHEITSFPYL